MSLYIDVDKVAEALLADGWHAVTDGSFDLDSYEFHHGDHVWEPTRQAERITCDTQTGIETVVTELRMHRTHSRTGLGQDNYFITRRAQREQGGNWLPGATRHELSDPGPQRDHDRTVARYVDALVEAGAPGGMGREKLREWATANGVELPGKVPVLAEVARLLKLAKEA